MASELKLEAIQRKDANGDIYYFTCPSLPVSVDLSKCVIFIRPFFDEDRNQEKCEIVVKSYDKKFRDRRGKEEPEDGK